MIARKLTAQQAGFLWARFYADYGPEVMMDAYGWSAPNARQLRPYERVWTFADAGAYVGWGLCSLNTKDPDDDEAVLVVGVDPGSRGRGYRHAILDWLSRWAATKGAAWAKIIVFKDNEANYERTYDEAYSDDVPKVWFHAGDVWLPAPGYGIFLRDLGVAVAPADQAVAA